MKNAFMGTNGLRKALATNPRTKALIDERLMADEQAVLKMMDVLEREVTRTVAEIPAAIQLLADHINDGKPLDDRWSVVYGEDDDNPPVVVYNGVHGVMNTTLIVHYDGFTRVVLKASGEWWSKSDFDDLDSDMMKRVDVANKLAVRLGAILLEAGETMMVIKIEAGGINSYAAIGDEPRMMSDNEWGTFQHERGYSHCTCGMCGDGSGFRDSLRSMLGNGGLFGGMMPR